MHSEFLKAFDTLIPMGAQVSVATEPVDLETLCDCQGRLIFGKHAAMGEEEHQGRLYFIDLEPQANWEHPCKYVVETPSSFYEMGWTMPPAEAIELKPLAPL